MFRSSFFARRRRSKKLKDIKTDQDRLNYLQEEVEQNYFDQYPQRLAELDKSWDALHRSLTDGKLEYNNGNFPLSHVILGGEILYAEDDYIMVLKTPEQVKQIAHAVNITGKAFLDKGYQQIDAAEYGFPLTDEDLEYTWLWFDGTKEFWKLAAEENRYVLFTADQ